MAGRVSHVLEPIADALERARIAEVGELARSHPDWHPYYRRVRLRCHGCADGYLVYKAKGKGAARTAYAFCDKSFDNRACTWSIGGPKYLREKTRIVHALVTGKTPVEPLWAFFLLDKPIEPQRKSAAK